MATGTFKARKVNPILLRPGEICPNCGLARLNLTPDREVACSLCGLKTGPPCT